MYIQLGLTIQALGRDWGGGMRADDRQQTPPADLFNASYVNNMLWCLDSEVLTGYTSWFWSVWLGAPPPPIFSTPN